MAEICYPGKELELFASAHTWRAYWTATIAGFLTGDVLEVGAGVGSVTRLMADRALTWHALEPDPGLAGRIVEWRDSARVQGLAVTCGTIDDLPATPTFDSILYADVLEHIEDDAAELERAYSRLRPGGYLVVVGPAHPRLFSPFDESVGHYRRYTTESLRAIAPRGSREMGVRYLDSVGMLASLANRLALRSSHPSQRQIWLWDRRMVPLSRLADPLLRYRLGKSVVVVWVRDPAGNAS
jgi:SAM-dependent methyltransferase